MYGTLHPWTAGFSPLDSGLWNVDSAFTAELIVDLHLVLRLGRHTSFDFAFDFPPPAPEPRPHPAVFASEIASGYLATCQGVRICISS